MEEASGERPMVLRQSVRVLQVTGCFHFPLNHRLNISMVIKVVSCWHLNVIVGMMAPSLSSSNRVPNFMYFIPTLAVMSMFPDGVGRLRSSGSIGFSSAVRKTERKERVTMKRVTSLGAAYIIL